MQVRYKKQAYQLANIGHWELDVENGELYWSDEIKKLHEVDPDYTPNLERAIEFYKEGEYRRKVRSAVNLAIESGEPFTFESKIITNKGNERWVRAIGEPKMKEGKCIRLFGSTQDITELKKTEKKARKVQEKLRDIIEHSTVMFYKHDANHQLTYLSPQSEYFLGCTPEEGKQKWTSFVTDHPKNKEGLKKTEKAIKTGQPQPPYELQLKRTDGRTIWVKVNESPITDEGETVAMVGCMTDITELKEKEYQLRNIANNIDGMVHRYQRFPDGHDEFIYVSEGVRDLHEVTPKEVLDDPGILWSQIIDEHIGDVKKSVDSSAETLDKWNHKWKIETPSGKKKWIHGRGTPKKIEDGSIIWDTILLDITEQEQAKNKQQELYRIIEESLNEVYIFETDSLEFVYFNSLARDHTGYTEDQLQKMTPLDLIEDIEICQNFDEYLSPLDRNNKEVVTFSTIHKRSDGSVYPVDVRLRKEEYNGKPVYVAVILDITNQKELEDHIKRQVSLLNHILDSLPGLFYMVGEDLTFARTNKNVEKLFGLSAEELQATNALTLVAPREQKRAKRLIGKAFQQGYAELETILIGKDGKEYHYYMNGSQIKLADKNYVIGSGIDVTKRIRTEEENRVLLQEIHHRVKNNLAIISGLLSLELQELSPDSYGQMPLERSINRIHSIAKVHELLYQSASFSYVNVKRYISELTDTAMTTLQKGDNIHIHLELDEIDMNINEVIPLGMLMNELLTNSLKYAFNEQGEGLIEVNVCKNGDRYEVYYRDNGKGFDRRDFENSETLGLTIVKMLLKQLEAKFEVDTEDGFELKFSFKEKKTGSHSNI